MSGVSRDGKRIAAIFDLDGTLLPEPSLERRLFRELRRSRRMTFANYLRWSVEACRLLPHGLLAVQRANKRYLSNVCASRAVRHLDSFTFFDEGIARVLWHARQKHEIVLLSGTLEALAQHAAAALEREVEARGIAIEARVCATKLAEEGGLWTGDVVGEPVFGTAKVRALRALGREAALDLRQSHAYGNCWHDRHVLDAVGHAHAVNPGKALAALANERDWPIWHWHIEKQVAPEPGGSIPENHPIEERA